MAGTSRGRKAKRSDRSFTQESHTQAGGHLIHFRTMVGQPPPVIESDLLFHEVRPSNHIYWLTRWRVLNGLAALSDEQWLELDPLLPTELKPSTRAARRRARYSI